MRIVFISREHPLGEEAGGIATYTETVTRHWPDAATTSAW